MTKKIELEDLKAAVSQSEKASSEGAKKETATPQEEGVEASKAQKEEEIVIAKPQIDELGRAYGTGKRKDAVARVWIKPGSGKVMVNGREGAKYFARPVLQMILNQPFAAVDRENQFDVLCTVRGGGLSGQAGAVRHGTSRALLNFDPMLRPILKEGGFLTRDARVVERKKYGRRKARRSFQFSKR